MFSWLQINWRSTVVFAWCIECLVLCVDNILSKCTQLCTHCSVPIWWVRHLLLCFYVLQSLSMLACFSAVLMRTCCKLVWPWRAANDFCISIVLWFHSWLATVCSQTVGNNKFALQQLFVHLWSLHYWQCVALAACSSVLRCAPQWCKYYRLLVQHQHLIWRWFLCAAERVLDFTVLFCAGSGRWSIMTNIIQSVLSRLLTELIYSLVLCFVVLWAAASIRP